MKVRLLTPARPMAEVEAKSVLLPGLLGYMEVLNLHASMVAELDCGKLSIVKDGGDVLDFFVAGGYVDVGANEVVILADVAEAKAQIDQARAKTARKRAEDRLTNITQLNLDIARAQYAKKRAQARLTLVE